MEIKITRTLVTDFDERGRGGGSVGRMRKERNQVSGQSRWWCLLLT